MKYASGKYFAQICGEIVPKDCLPKNNHGNRKTTIPLSIFPAFGHVLFLDVISFTQGRLHQVVNITAKIKYAKFSRFLSICP